MKAAVLDSIKAPLRVEDRPIPEPKPTEIIVRQRITGICYRDILEQDGFFPRAKFPVVPGHEITGIVTNVGSEVRGFRISDRVASLIYKPCGTCTYCMSGNENLCPNKVTYGENVDGSYAEYIAIDQKSAVKVPNGVGEYEAAIASCVTGMIVHAIRKIGDIKPGQKILITGAGGGVGSHAVEVSKLLGATVIAETSSPDKSEVLKSLGADHVVQFSERFDRKVRDIIPEGVDLALETTGNYTFEQALRSLKVGGGMIVVGNINPEPAKLPLGILILKGNSVTGSISSTRNDLGEALELAASGKFKAVIDKTYDIEDVNMAYSEIRSRKNTGKVFLKFR